MEKADFAARYYTIANGRMTNETQMANSEATIVTQMPIELVDREGDRLTEKYKNYGYRRWYRMVIHCLGDAKVHELEKRAEDGTSPAKLFTRLANEALRYSETYKSIQRRKAQHEEQ